MEKVILLVHGYKRHEQHDFDDFFLYAKDKLNCPIEKVYWFDNYDKKTLTTESFLTQIDQVMEKYQDKEIIIISYSMGACLFLTEGYKWKNITDIFAIYPTYYISHFGWLGKIFKTIKLRRKLRKKLSKERYKRLLQNKEKAPVEKYPIRLTLEMNNFRMYLLKNLGKVTDKNLYIFLNHKDEANKTKKTYKVLKKRIDTDNRVTYYWINESHYTILIHNPDLYDQLIDLLNL